jgi:hypothetical protein
LASTVAVISTSTNDVDVRGPDFMATIYLFEVAVVEDVKPIVEDGVRNPFNRVRGRGRDFDP